MGLISLYAILYVENRLVNFHFFGLLYTIDDRQYKVLMDTINSSKQELKLTELRKEVTQAQERTSAELTFKLNKSSYRFRQKGNEVQFHFNKMVEDSISSAKKEFSQFVDNSNVASSKGQKAAVKRIVSHLDDGMKAITKRQTHIKVANRSDYGWATVQAYDTDDLASGSDDEKRLEKAKKEAERRATKEVVVTASVRPVAGVIFLLQAGKIHLPVCNPVDHQSPQCCQDLM